MMDSNLENINDLEEEILIDNNDGYVEAWLDDNIRIEDLIRDINLD